MEQSRDSKVRVLFVGEGVTLAHIVRPLALSRSLDRNLFDVSFACSTRYSKYLRGEPLTYWPIYSRSPEEFDAVLASGKALFDERVLKRYVSDDLALLEASNPDVVVGDFRQSLVISAQAAGLPFIALSNAYWSRFACLSELPLPSYDFVRALGLHKLEQGVAARIVRSLFRLTTPFALNLQLAGINSVRQKYGLEPFDDYLTAFTFGDRTLFVDVPSVAPVSRLRNSESYVGHVAWNSDAELPKWWDSLPRDRPLAYIALGSSGDLGAIPLVCKAVNQAGCLAVVSTADRFNSSDLPGDVYSAAFLPGDRVARRASLVVSNGGSPTSYQALEQGIPVLGIARNMDQLVCMANIQEVGAGLLLRADSLKQSSLNMAVERLVRERSFTTAARSLSQEFSEYDSAARLRDTILELSQAKRYRRMKTTAFASR